MINIIWLYFTIWKKNKKNLSFKKTYQNKFMVISHHPDLHYLNVLFLSHVWRTLCRTIMFSVNLCACAKEKDCACTCVSMLTTSQHRDAWSHIQIQGRFERVASCRADAADQRQEPQRQGSSSLHLRRAPHGTVRSLRPGRTHRQHIHLTTRKHTHAVTHPHNLTKHWQAGRQAGSL